MFSSKKKGRAHITEDDPQFSVRYVGKIRTFTASGQGCTQEPVQKIWDGSPEEKDMKRLVVTVNPLGIFLRDPAQKSIECETLIDIKDISYCCAQTGIHERIFSWISKDGKDKRIDCHAVLCLSSEEAKRMSLALSHAFRVAYKSWKHDKEKMARAKQTSMLQNKQQLSDGSINNDTTNNSQASETESGSSSDVEVNDDFEGSSILADAMARMNFVEEGEISFSESHIVVDSCHSSANQHG